MADTGMANMDMEFIKYLIGLFKMYYPDFLNYILVFEMPWILNGKLDVLLINEVMFLSSYIQGVPGGMCQTSGGCSLC